MAGIWPLSYTQCIGLNGRPLVGARAYFFEAGTTTPLQTYTDYTLAVPNPSYIETDGYGRWQAAFLDDSAAGFYRVRVTEANGTTIFDVDAQPIVGPNAGGGGDPPAPVDPDSLMKTGDIKIRYSTGVIAGFVRGNGRTIGSATSGASERANADTQPLYEYLWQADSTLAVSGGRGVSATADFEANKTLTLPDCRGRVLAGLDGMGNSAAGRLTGFTALGQAIGAQSHTLTEAQLPALTKNLAGVPLPPHGHRVWGGTGLTGNVVGIGHSNGFVGVAAPDGSNANVQYRQNAGQTSTPILEGTGAGTPQGTISFGSGQSHPIVQPSLAVTFYIKL